jgi:hypothetical protein
MKFGDGLNEAVNFIDTQTGTSKEATNRKSRVMTPTAGWRPFPREQTARCQ